jgi:hypothetical protein
MVTATVFQRLPQGLQCIFSELRQFIQKQHTIMSEADLSRLRSLPTANHTGIRNGVMGRPEGTRSDKDLFPVQQSGDRINFRNFPRFLKGQRRKNGGKSLRQHGFPEPGEPIIRRLCPPAAATSNARFA